MVMRTPPEVGQLQVCVASPAHDPQPDTDAIPGMVGKTSLSSPVEELWPPTTTVKKYSSAGSPVAVLHKIEEGENLPTDR